MFFTEKNKIRKEIKNTLNENKPFFSKWSDIICKKLLHSTEYQQCTIILAYMPLPDEVDIQPVIAKAFFENKKVYIPKIIPDTNQMDFYKFKPQSYEPGSFGILEPDTSNELFSSTNISNESILVLVPGRAFSKDGKRLGRGKGFYDTFLSQFFSSVNSLNALQIPAPNIQEKKGDPANCQITLLGICFECQLLEDLPTEAHDIKMDKIISEE